MDAYVTPDWYYNVYDGRILSDMHIAAALRRASRHIDTLTYNRIVGQGFSNLTAFQQGVIRDVVCQQAEFEAENADMIDTVLTGYSVNGVSVQFGESWNVHVDRGVAIRRDTYSLLCQTGLCCRIVG